MVAVAEWSVGDALHWSAGTLNTKIAWAQLQYVGITSVPPLWLMFVARYTGAGWVERGSRIATIWIVPVFTLMLALTAPNHRMLWQDIEVTPDGRALYTHGWAFYLIVGYSYLLLVAATLHLIRAARRSPLYRGQLSMLLVAAAVPWAGNLVYVTGPDVLGGVDPTPISFAVSGAITTWVLYRRDLFELVPVARDLVLDSLDEGVLVLDSAGRLLDVNAPAAALASGTTPWLGRQAVDLFPFLKGTAVEAPFTGISFSGGDARTGKQYDVVITEVRPSLLSPAAWLVVLRDVTEQRRAAAEREALDRLKRDVVSVVSHELRTPLTAVRGALQVILENDEAPLRPEQRRLLSVAYSSCDRLMRIANDMLDMSRLEMNRLGLRRSAVAVAPLLRAALFDVGESARQASVRIDTDVPADTPPLLADGDRVVQVLVNLLSNAIKVSSAGSAVAVTVRAAGEFVRFDVRDEGPGLSVDERARLFEQFQPLDPAGTRKPGTGLGLVIARGLVQQHGGQVSVDSTPGRGSTFTVTLPRAQEPTFPIPPESHEPPLARTPVDGRHPSHVLVCDDDDDIRAVLSEALRQRRYRVSGASNGQEALDRLAEGGIDLLILDLQMPVVDGATVIRTLEHGPTPPIPIIVLTGDVDRHAIEGANRVFTKPADMRALMSAVDTLLLDATRGARA